MWKYKSIHETEVLHLKGVSSESKLKLSWVRLEMLHRTAGTVGRYSNNLPARLTKEKSTYVNTTQIREQMLHPVGNFICLLIKVRVKFSNVMLIAD